MTSIAVLGAAGRMGRRLLALSSEFEGLRLAAALEHSGHPDLGRSAAELAAEPALESTNVVLTDSFDTAGQIDVLIDFTGPAATRAALETCQRSKTAMVIGTTGLTDNDHRLIDDAAKMIPILQAPNMSLGVNLLFALAAQAATRLDQSWDIEITEAHHRFKKDAPSGTALGIVSAICDATGKNADETVAFGAYGADPDNAPRQPGQIGVHSIRMGDVVGEHTATFAAMGERIALTHTASSRDIFARGALKAAAWLGGKSPARYRMGDVLGL